MSLREQVRHLIEDTETPAARAFDWSIQGLIIASVITFSLETLPDQPRGVRVALGGAELVFTIVFTVEYLLRLWAAERRLAYVFSFYGLIDLLAIAPFYVTLLVPRTDPVTLQAIRVFRLMRMFRLLKPARYNRAMRRFQRAFDSIRSELILTGSVTGCVIFFAAVMIYHFEREAQPEAFGSVFHSLWWSVVTLTTVGYGDVYPLTAGGRFFTGLLLIAGLGLVSVPSGLIASAMTATRQEVEGETAEEADRGERSEETERGEAAALRL